MGRNVKRIWYAHHVVYDMMWDERESMIHVISCNYANDAQYFLQSSAN